MRVIRCSSPQELARKATPMLVRDEAVNNWTIGFLAEYDAGSRPNPSEQLTLLAIEDDFGEVVGTAVSTGESLVVTQMSGEAITTLLEFLAREKIDQPKTSGPAQTVGALARSWAERRKVAASVSMGMRIMRLEQVRPPAVVSGAFRVATMNDLALLMRWGEAFDRELGFSTRDMEQVVARRIELNRLYVWCDPDPVSMAASAGPTPSGVRINFVYTPPEHRNRGYARACVASLSQRLLDSGKSFVFLYVDAENQTTNRLYRAIGYENVCDWEDWRFADSPA